MAAGEFDLIVRASYDDAERAHTRRLGALFPGPVETDAVRRIKSYTDSLLPPLPIWEDDEDDDDYDWPWP